MSPLIGMAGLASSTRHKSAKALARQSEPSQRRENLAHVAPAQADADKDAGEVI